MGILEKLLEAHTTAQIGVWIRCYITQGASENAERKEIVSDYLETFIEGTFKAALIGAVSGFFGFGLVASALYYRQVDTVFSDSIWAVPIGGAIIFGFLGLLSGGIASCLNLARTGGKKKANHEGSTP